MSATMKFGEIETVVRRDLIKDDDSEKCRWSSFQIIAAAVRAVRDVINANEWASYDQDTGLRIRSSNTGDIMRYCEANPKALAETTSFVVNGTTLDTDQYLSHIRGLTVPIDDRWHDAVAYFSAYHVLDTAGDDAELRRRSNEFLQIAKENAAL